MADKIFCYVDESGQDTRGRLFIVSVVVTGNERNQLRLRCEDIERRSGKGERKWSKTSRARRVSYIQELLEQKANFGRLYYRVCEGIEDYLTATVDVIARVLEINASHDSDTTILIDGLSRSLERAVGLNLRRLGIHVKKVRGLDEENDALMRLADAVCGLVRAGLEGDPALGELWLRGLQVGFLHDVSDK